ncbi:hypothetical protein PF011_g30392, partial [Phytophthora fragariae]
TRPDEGRGRSAQLSRLSFYTHWAISICASEQPSPRKSGPS